MPRMRQAEGFGSGELCHPLPAVRSAPAAAAAESVISFGQGRHAKICEFLHSSSVFENHYADLAS